MKKKTQAFSFIEVLIVVAIIGLVTAYGLPAMKAFQVNTGLTTNTNDLVTSLQMARSASIRLQGRVVVCASTTSMTDDPNCSTSANWHDGWIVFHDKNDNAIIDAGPLGADVVLRVQSGVVMPGLTIVPEALGGTPTNIGHYISFGPPAGEPALIGGENQSGIFKLCSDQDLSRVRGVVVHFSGRISSTRDNIACS